jgi:hypothetical protein
MLGLAARLKQLDNHHAAAAAGTRMTVHGGHVLIDRAELAPHLARVHYPRALPRVLFYVPQKRPACRRFKGPQVCGGASPV